MGNKEYLGSDLQVNENKEITCAKIVWKIYKIATRNLLCDLKTCI